MTPVRPKFSNAPLIERAVSVVFDPLPALTLGEYGLFWAEIIDEFPISEALEPAMVDLERFDAFQPAQAGFQIMPANSIPRAAFRNSDTGELVQVQADRFGFNWIKVGTDHDYPHSEAILGRFFELFERFSSFATRRNLGPLSIVQCELTNVNVVPVSDVGTTHADIATVFKLAPLEVESSNIRLENQLVGSKHIIYDDEGVPLGRIHTLGQPVVRVPDNEEAYRLDIAARGAPMGPGTDGARRFFEEAVSAVNAVFLASSTKAGQQFWGRA